MNTSKVLQIFCPNGPHWRLTEFGPRSKNGGVIFSVGGRFRRGCDCAKSASPLQKGDINILYPISGGSNWKVEKLCKWFCTTPPKKIATQGGQ